MFQVIVMWNLTRPDQELNKIVNNIRLRGYNQDTFLTGEFAWKLAEEKIRPLSVSDISDKYCPTRRDLYFKKGIRRLSKQWRKGEDTWGSTVGTLVESYIINIFTTSKTSTSRTSENPNYNYIVNISERNYNNFIDRNKRFIERLEELEKKQPEEKGNTQWLKKLLKSGGRAELALNYLNELLKDDISITKEDILTGNSAKIDVSSKEMRFDKIKQIGINLPAIPDFIIPKYGIVGDIKTGIEFKPHFQLTCAGYALAYENVNGEGNHINWGIIYFFPTRNPSLFRKSITFAQVYIFPIDDYLRKEFLAKRDEAYNVISKEPEPPLPLTDKEKRHCYRCKFKNFCIQEGLVLEYRNE